MLIRRPYYYNDPKCLGVFLQCEVTSHTWKIDAFAILRLHRETGESIPRVIVHEYSEKENDWGFSTLIRLQELFNPAEGYIKDDTLTLSAEIYADPPRSILSRCEFFRAIDFLTRFCRYVPFGIGSFRGHNSLS